MPQDVVEFDPFYDAFFDDPFDTYRWLRDEAPPYFNERRAFYALSRFDDVLAAHRDSRRMVSSYGVTVELLLQKQPFDTNTMIVTRGGHTTLAFGCGVHSCLDAWLARLESRICVQADPRRLAAPAGRARRAPAGEHVQDRRILPRPRDPGCGVIVAGRRWPGLRPPTTDDDSGLPVRREGPSREHDLTEATDWFLPGITDA